MTSVFVYEHLSGGEDAPGALLPEGLAMRDALAGELARSAGLQVTVAASMPAAEVTGAARLMAGLQAGPWAVPRAGRRDRDADAPRVEILLRRPGRDPLAFVAAAAAAHALSWVVAPETDGWLARLQRVIGPARWLGCDAAAIALCSDKTATLRCLAAQGLPTPLNLAAAGPARAWVVKPADGAGALATHRHRTRAAAEADLADRCAAGRPAVLEPWVDGDALSLSLLCSVADAGQPAGVELLSVNRQQIEVQADGTLGFQGVEIAVMAQADRRWPQLQDLARRVRAAVPGLRGMVGVDLVWHADCGPVAIEINPRLTSAFPGLSTRLGRNLAGECVARHCTEHGLGGR